MPTRVLLLPGWQNSGPSHWQSLWEHLYGFTRVEQDDWLWPRRGDWMARLDEVVLQIYQGRHVIPGYARYFTKVGRLKVPFKIGLLQGGEWTTPAGVETHAMFKGYVVFLVNP